MQASASEWFRGELVRASQSCPDLRGASVAIRERQRREQRGKGGLQEIFDATMHKVLGSPSHDTGEVLAATSEEEPKRRDVLADGGLIYVDKVERWHRGLVWSQQFNFFDRHISNQVDVEDAEAQHVEAEPERSRYVAPEPRKRGKKVKPVPAPPLRNTAHEVATWTTTYKPKPPRVIEPRMGGLTGPSLSAADMAQTLPACWRMGSSVSTPTFKSGTGVAVSSQPGVLDSWSQGYYGESAHGGGTREHEDVLHTVNPDVFPLQDLPLRAPTPLTPLAAPGALTASLSGALDGLEGRLGDTQASEDSLFPGESPMD